MQRQLGYEAAKPFVPDRVENDQEENSNRHAEGYVHIGSGHDLHVRDAGRASEQRDPIDRNEVHQVHQENPDEYGQTQRRYEPALAVKGVFNRTVDEIDDDLDNSLKAARLAR